MEKKNTTQKNSFYLEQRSFSLKIGLHVLIIVSTSKKLWIKENYSPRREKIKQVLFLPVEIIIEIRNNQIFKR